MPTPKPLASLSSPLSTATWSRAFSDALFMVLAAGFCLLAYRGTLALTPCGIGMDGDLQNYTQILDWMIDPAPFATDAVATTYPAYPGIPNFQTLVASLCGGDPATSLFRAGACGIFLHLACYYVLGRRIFGRPSAAAFLAVLMSITVYWSYGTFWGATHADPVPRVFHSAVFALILIPAIEAVRRPLLRPLVMLLVGASVSIHSVSGLVCGAMLFAGYFFIPAGQSICRHAVNLLAGLVAFFVPTLVFLFSIPIPSAEGLSFKDKAIMNELWQIRFGHDYGGVWLSLGRRVLKYTAQAPILSAGLAAAIVLYVRKKQLDPQAHSLVIFMPGLLLGLAGVCAICLGESIVSAQTGRPQIGYDLLRGTRMIIPLSWLMISALVLPMLNRWDRRLLPLALTGLVVCTLALSLDKQVFAARHAAAELTGLSFLESPRALRMMRQNEAHRAALDALREKALPGESAMTDVDEMGIRYYAHLPMHPIFKDGDLVYYARDVALARIWLRTMELMDEENGTAKAWKESPAQLLLAHRTDCAGISIPSTVLYEADGWCIARKLKAHEPGSRPSPASQETQLLQPAGQTPATSRPSESQETPQ